jgi:prevent-host-death family protein
MIRRSVTQARHEFSRLLDLAAGAGLRTVVSRRGKDLAAIVPIADLDLLDRLSEALQDRQDVEDARADLAQPGNNVSWAGIKSRFGL